MGEDEDENENEDALGPNVVLELDDDNGLPNDVLVSRQRREDENSFYSHHALFPVDAL